MHPLTEGCQCDDCIKTRVRQRVREEERARVQQAYEKRRGAKLGSISVAEALKGRRK